MKFPSATKKGPGRFPKHGEAKGKHPIARKGGNWQGLLYKSQPEIDSETRARLNERLHGAEFPGAPNAGDW